ncbi:S8 family serine peptidase [bacterium]|nr:S8 family serine peptidase [bacterium]
MHSLNHRLKITTLIAAALINFSLTNPSFADEIKRYIVFKNQSRSVLAATSQRILAQAQERTTLAHLSSEIVSITAEQASALAGDANVTEVIADREIKLVRDPNDPLYINGYQWGLSQINAQGLWDSSTNTSSVVIANLDTGVDYTHPDLAPSIWRNTAEISNNGVDDDGNGLIDDLIGFDFADNDANPIDLDGHGTGTAGISAARGNDGYGMTGVSWQSKIIPLKVFSDNGQGFLSAVLQSINYVIHLKSTGKANIALLNMSFGYQGYSKAIENAFAALDAYGIVAIAAAGNEAVNNDSSRHALYPASFDLPNMISVAASTENGTLASFSNYGLRSVDLAAPGTNIAMPVPLSYGWQTPFGLADGTSFSAPIVSGVVAHMLSQNPGLTPLQIRAILNKTVTQTPSFQGKTVSAGVVNASRAVQASVNLPLARVTGKSTARVGRRNKNLAGVKVRLVSEDGRLAYETKTNSSGRYTFSNIPPGNYYLSPSRRNYRFTRSNYTTGDIMGGTVEVKFSARRRR